MYRRTLILRRFGALSFGLGYVEGGIWIDHREGDGLVADADPEIQAVHAWLGCCPLGVDLIPMPISAAPERQERFAIVARSASS
jgi:hypothetical protein